jgi:cell shape-determining protein MreC
MLGLGNARLNELDAENRRLRAELLAQTQRAEGLRSVIGELRRENDALNKMVDVMAASTRHATQQAQAGCTVDVTEPVNERFVWN